MWLEFGISDQYITDQVSEEECLTNPKDSISVSDFLRCLNSNHIVDNEQMVRVRSSYLYSYSYQLLPHPSIPSNQSSLCK